VIEQSQTVSGVAKVLGWDYNDADQVTAITYPNGEQVSYTYDAAGRQASACSSLGGCYVSNISPATYTALNQPDNWTLGNGLTLNWSYDSTLARLSR
jgi:YD repeat-containing protein